jgi:hypothetical protein
MKKFNSVSEYTTKNLPFHIAGSLCVGENLLIYADVVEWSFPSSKNMLSKVNNKYNNNKAGSISARLKNIESKLFKTTTSQTSSSSQISSSSQASSSSSLTHSPSSHFPSPQTPMGLLRLDKGKKAIRHEEVIKHEEIAPPSPVQPIIEVQDPDDYHEDILDAAIASVEKTTIKNTNNNITTRSKRQRTNNIKEQSFLYY